jgi:hypothetical protein
MLRFGKNVVSIDTTMLGRWVDSRMLIFGTRLVSIDTTTFVCWMGWLAPECYDLVQAWYP